MTKILLHTVRCMVVLALFLMGSPVWSESLGGDSFSPIYMTNNKGKPLKLTWIYGINNGKTLHLDRDILGESVHLNIRFGSLTITVNPLTKKRTVFLPVTISGTVSGFASVKIIEDLQPFDSGKSLVNSQRLVLKVTISAYGQTARVNANVAANFTPAVEWFLDRNDLDRLGLGYRFIQPELVEGQVQGKVCASVSGRNRCTPVDTSAVSQETWEIVDVLEAVSVRKKTYLDVVEVERQTSLPSIDPLNGEVATEPFAVTYWVAKGIGMVKGVGQYNFLGSPLNIELKKFTRVRAR